MNKQQAVTEFMQKFAQECPTQPTIPSFEIQQLRIELIQEELFELRAAMAGCNLYETADAIADLLYVVYGTAVACGIDIDKVFEEVHRSNMSKLWTMAELQQLDDKPEYTIVSPKNILSDRNVRQFVVKNAIGKVVKSPSYHPANIVL